MGCSTVTDTNASNCGRGESVGHGDLHQGKMEGEIEAKYHDVGVAYEEERKG